VTDDDERRRALDRSIRALARRDHSAATLRAKLDRAGISPTAQTVVVETLERIGYVDDERFAQDRAAQLAERGYGDEWIRADLEAQGVGRELVDPALTLLQPELDRAATEAANAGGGLRSVRMLARRGFSDETLEVLMDDAVAAEPHEE
jgi:regulatory protein